MNKNLTELIKYVNKWVAIIPKTNEVVASGNSVREVEQKVSKKHLKEAVITFVTPPDMSLAPYAGN